MIEVLLRTKVDTSGIKSFRSNIVGLKSAIIGLTGGLGIGALVRNIEEAEKATAQLDAAFSNTGRTLGLTRQRLDELATELQRTTRYGDDLVQEAESILLTFDKVRGEGFERTIKVAADLSARLGTDLKSSVRQLGLALQDPAEGLSLLRRSGVSFTNEQRAVINRLVETNDLAKAQAVILDDLQRRYGGAAAAARNTLGGALAGLKNQFGDLFESTSTSTASAVTSINGLSEALADPRVKSGLDYLIKGMADLAGFAVRAAAETATFMAQLRRQDVADALQALGTAVPAASALRPVGAFLGALPEPATAHEGGHGPLRRRARVDRLDTGARELLREVSTTARALADEVPQFLRQMSDATLTETERQVAAYHELQEALEALRSEGLITSAQQEARLQEGLDQLLPEIDIQAIRKLYLPIRRETTELGEFMRGVWQNVGRSIHSTLSDALYEWRLSWRSLLDIARRALADITAAIITSGIKNALKSATSSSSGSSTSSILGFIGSLFGLAGGGRFDGVRKVGEDDAEIVAGTGYVYNRRQMAFAGGGSITFAPHNIFNIIEREDPNQTKRELTQYVEVRNAQQQAEFVRLLQRSGYEVKG